MGNVDEVGDGFLGLIGEAEGGALVGDVLAEQLEGGLVAAFETNPMAGEGGGVEELGEQVLGECLLGQDFGTKPILESFEVLLLVGTHEEGLGVEGVLKLFSEAGGGWSAARGR